MNKNKKKLNRYIYLYKKMQNRKGFIENITNEEVLYKYLTESEVKEFKKLTYWVKNKL